MKDLPSKEDAIRWRLTDAHNSAFMDHASHVSLIARVCGDDDILTFGNRQLEIVRGIRRFTGPVAGLGFISTGPLLCAMVLFVWFTNMVREIQRVVDVTLSLSALPRSVTR